jgi:hypothetical protein
MKGGGLMPNNYTIMLSAKINDASLKAHIDSLANRYTLMLRGVISSAATAASTAASTGAGGATAATSAAAAATKTLTVNSVDVQKALNAELQTAKDLGQTYKTNTNAIGNLTRVKTYYTDELGRSMIATSQFSNANQKVEKTLLATGNQIKNNQDHTKNWTQQIQNNTAKVVQWAVATMLIYGSLKKIQEGIQYISELNKSLTNISIVTGMTRIQTNELAQTYNQLAKQMGVSTKAVADGSLEWFRQGKTIEQTTELMKSSLMMATLGNMTAADSTEKLTATLNGFQMQAEDSVSVVDRLVALDNAYATSVNEIATAMQYSAAVSKQAGVSFNELASYIN